MENKSKFKVGDKVKINPATTEPELMENMFGEENYTPTDFHFKEIMGGIGVVLDEDWGVTEVVVNFPPAKWGTSKKVIPQKWIIGEHLLILAE